MLGAVAQSGVVATVLDMLQTLLPAITANYDRLSPVGSAGRAMRALQELGTKPKTCETTDQLMVIFYEIQ